MLMNTTEGLRAVLVDFGLSVVSLWGWLWLSVVYVLKLVTFGRAAYNLILHSITNDSPPYGWLAQAVDFQSNWEMS